jgi:thyroglobulin type-1 repeat protein
MRWGLPIDAGRVLRAKVDAGFYEPGCDGAGSYMRASCSDGHGQAWCWCCHHGAPATPVRNGMVRLDPHQWRQEGRP